MSDIIMSDIIMSDIIMSNIVMSDIVIDIISDIRIYVDRPKYEIVSSSPLDIRMILGLLMKLYREWAVVFVSGGASHKHKSWAVNRYIFLYR